MFTRMNSEIKPVCCIIKLYFFKSVLQLQHKEQIFATLWVLCKSQHKRLFWNCKFWDSFLSAICLLKVSFMSTHTNPPPCSAAVLDENARQKCCHWMLSCFFTSTNVCSLEGWRRKQPMCEAVMAERLRCGIQIPQGLHVQLQILFAASIGLSIHQNIYMWACTVVPYVIQCQPADWQKLSSWSV